MTDANLFGVPGKKPRKVLAVPAAGADVQRLIGVWATLFEARFGEKPIVTGKDGAALKRLITHKDAATVERRLAAYLRLDDPYLAGQGYPLSLMLGAWNRLVALESDDAPSRVPNAASTDAYLRGLKGAS